MCSLESEPLEEPIAVPVYNGNSIWIGHRDMVRLDPDELAVSLVGIVDHEVSTTSSALVPASVRRLQWHFEKPILHEACVSEGCGKWRRDIVEAPSLEVWNEEED